MGLFNRGHKKTLTSLFHFRKRKKYLLYDVSKKYQLILQWFSMYFESLKKKFFLKLFEVARCKFSFSRPKKNELALEKKCNYSSYHNLSAELMLTVDSIFASKQLKFHQLITTLPKRNTPYSQ